jgi:hypothetical protein
MRIFIVSPHAQDSTNRRAAQGARNAPKRLARQQKLLPRKEKEGTYAMEWGENERKKCAW